VEGDRLRYQNGFPTKPLLRWAGGKRLIVPRLRDFLPATFGTYFEPMLGAGALFFGVGPKRAVLADVNPELINFYRVIKSDPQVFQFAVKQLGASKTFYYRIRESNPVSPIDRAVRFFYLIRLSWNGIYRVNKRGQFNVPFGGRTPKELVLLESVLKASRALQNARLLCGDFEDTTRTARTGDLVYLDPPYPKGAVADNGFDRYHKTKFTLDDHRRLHSHASRLADRGIHVLLTEAPTEEIIRLYKRDFDINVLKSSSLIAADGKCRGLVKEAVITSYKVERSQLKSRSERNRASSSHRLTGRSISQGNVYEANFLDPENLSYRS
jgi:DNA adenine methylase